MILLADLLGPSKQGWGRPQGREIFPKLLEQVERNPDQTIFAISLKGVRCIDVSFSSETVVAVAHRFLGRKGFYLVDVDVPDILENIEAAALRDELPLLVLDGGRHRFVGLAPSTGTKATLDVVLQRPQARATEIADAIQITVANASMKLKQLWTSGFLMRRVSAADTGGVEFIYHRIA